jgi:adenylate cyclase, class 2
MQAMETEVKIRIADRDSFEQRLPQLGLKRVTPRTFERNTLYDTPERKLRGVRQILRLRHYGDRWVLTHKSIPADDSPEESHKRRLETETTIEDGDALSSIFEILGLFPVFIYEKWRTEWADRQGHCVLDETPLGLFAELEGPSEWIDRTASQLHIPRNQYIKLSYGRMFEVWRDEHCPKIQHMTFADIPPIFRQ